MSSTQQLLLGEGAGGAAPVYVEDVFSTWLYTGNDSTQTITNGIDLSTKGGLVWMKSRTDIASHALYDTVRGATQELESQATNAQTTRATGLTAFNSNGFSIGSRATINSISQGYASWTFREQPKFFDVVTYTGNGANNRQIAHNLGSVPGCIMVKRTNASSDWYVYHRGLNGGTNPQNYYILLNSTAAQGTYEVWENTAPTSTVFTVDEFSSVNGSGDTFVAYIFAHDAGGFGAAGTDNVISCGSFTPDVYGNVTVNLGYEAQWILYKGISGAGGTDSWVILDTMRGWNMTTSDKRLFPNSSGAENTSSAGYPTATGFQVENLSASPYIYIAIRRGPMKVPTSGTSVFAPALGVSTTPNMVAGFPVDSFLGGDRDTPTSTNWKWWDRLRGNVASLLTTTTAAEDTSEYDYGQFQSMTGFKSGNYDASDKIGWMFRRAPQFFDEVCYTGTGTSNSSVNHNLGVVPELFFVKRRNSGGSGDVNWGVYSKDRPSADYNLILNSTTGWYNAGTNGWFGTGTLSSTLFPSGNASANFGNLSGGTYVAYLFATCAGVSKVGSYTGTGSTQTINCGFTGGARFVLIKRTDSTGDWYVWDTARGMVSGTDPSLLLNSTAAEVNANSVYTATTGFQIVSTASGINASGGTYIFLAIA